MRHVNRFFTLLLCIIVLYYLKYGTLVYHLGALLFGYPKELVFAFTVYKYRIRLVNVLKFLFWHSLLSNGEPSKKKTMKTMITRKTTKTKTLASSPTTPSTCTTCT